MQTQIKLSEADATSLQTYLRNEKLIQPNENIVEFAPAGEGNMNHTLRVSTNQRSIILKQSLPYVAKYPDIPAPENRIFAEYQFYEQITQVPKLAAKMPKILGFDQRNHLMTLSDCGKNPDFSHIYNNEKGINQTTLTEIAHWLAELHKLPLSTNDKTKFANREMRALNHLHIFEFPLNPKNGFDLESICSGLTDEAQKIQSNEAFISETKRIGKIYLNDGDTLIHGDCFPGSLLDTDKGPMIIDPEFCHCGFREFDLGVLYAHLLMSKELTELAERFLNLSKGILNYDVTLTQKVAGIEIMRRIIGVAQIPAKFDLKQRSKLLRLATKLVLNTK